MYVLNIMSNKKRKKQKTIHDLGRSNLANGIIMRLKVALDRWASAFTSNPPPHAFVPFLCVHLMQFGNFQQPPSRPNSTPNFTLTGQLWKPSFTNSHQSKQNHSKHTIHTLIFTGLLA